MNDLNKNLTTELKLFELYGLQDVIAAARAADVASAEFASLAVTVLSERQAQAFVTRWSSLSAAEQSQICQMLEKEDG